MRAGAGKYSGLLRRLTTMRLGGKRRNRLKARAVKYRRRLVKNPNFHLEDLFKGVDVRQKMPRKYKAALRDLRKNKYARKALARHKMFTGIPYPTRLEVLDDGSRNQKHLVVLGTEPAVLYADGPEHRHTKVRKLKGRWIVTTTPDGKQIIVLRKGKSQKNFGKKKKFLGWIPETHYVLSKSVEDAGSFKRGKFWIHHHGRSERGFWPKAWLDAVGNVIYERGGNKYSRGGHAPYISRGGFLYEGRAPKGAPAATYAVTKWIHK